MVDSRVAMIGDTSKWELDNSALKTTPKIHLSSCQDNWIPRGFCDNHTPTKLKCDRLE
jgi:hypothetical protein